MKTKNVKENDKQRNKVTLANFNPKNRLFLRNIPEIFNRRLQRPRNLSGQYCCVPFIQKKHAIRLQLKKNAILSVSIIKVGVFGIEDRSEKQEVPLLLWNNRKKFHTFSSFQE